MAVIHAHGAYLTEPGAMAANHAHGAYLTEARRSGREPRPGRT
jgi:hypothetical protein